MNRPVILRPDAEQDVRGIHASLEQIRAGLGDRFTVLLGETLEQIATTPELFGLIEYDVRAVRIRRLRYIVYYMVMTNQIEVLAVLHGARDAGIWQARI